MSVSVSANARLIRTIEAATLGGVLGVPKGAPVDRHPPLSQVVVASRAEVADSVAVQPGVVRAAPVRAADLGRRVADGDDQDRQHPPGPRRHRSELRLKERPTREGKTEIYWDFER